MGCFEHEIRQNEAFLFSKKKTYNTAPEHFSQRLARRLERTKKQTR